MNDLVSHTFLLVFFRHPPSHPYPPLPTAAPVPEPSVIASCDTLTDLLCHGLLTGQIKSRLDFEEGDFWHGYSCFQDDVSFPFYMLCGRDEVYCNSYVDSVVSRLGLTVASHSLCPFHRSSRPPVCYPTHSLTLSHAPSLSIIPPAHRLVHSPRHRTPPHYCITHPSPHPHTALLNQQHAPPPCSLRLAYQQSCPTPPGPQPPPTPLTQAHPPSSVSPPPSHQQH